MQHHQQPIDRAQRADIRDDLTSFEQIKPGAWWVSIGKHPNLGCITVIEDLEGLFMLSSENPLGSLEADEGEPEEAWLL